MTAGMNQYPRPQKETPVAINDNDADDKPGGGGRFAALKAALAKRKGVSNPGGLAASIGRAKYGRSQFQSMAAKGRKQSEES